ncbi:hypothetical protein B0H19DRAFT_1073924 [Mycena capillaripes]|nr:hypothetical protein B0H19DRAFT_1073924 [Mycena capillaripes]
MVPSKERVEGLKATLGTTVATKGGGEWWGKFLMNLRTGLKMGTTTLKPETKDKKKLRFELGSRHSGHGGDSQIDHVEVENQMRKEQDINLRVHDGQQWTARGGNRKGHGGERKKGMSYDIRPLTDLSTSGYVCD